MSFSGHVNIQCACDYWGDVAFWYLGLLQYEITVLTALIPPLIIVIWIPNCIFLRNKYQQDV